MAVPVERLDAEHEGSYEIVISRNESSFYEVDLEEQSLQAPLQAPPQEPPQRLELSTSQKPQKTSNKKACCCSVF